MGGGNVHVSSHHRMCANGLVWLERSALGPERSALSLSDSGVRVSVIQYCIISHICSHAPFQSQHLVGTFCCMKSSTGRRFHSSRPKRSGVKYLALILSQQIRELAGSCMKGGRESNQGVYTQYAYVMNSRKWHAKTASPSRYKVRRSH